MSFINKVVTLSLITLSIAACSNNNNRYKREVSGNESYLHVPELKELVAPDGIVLPEENDEFKVPENKKPGHVGKQLDVRPPEQILTPMKNTIVTYRKGAAHMYFLVQKLNWDEILNALKNEDIEYKIDGANTVTTGKVVYTPLDEELPITVRYRVSTYMVNHNQQAFDVEAIEVLQGDTPITEDSYLQRYAVIMLNRLSLSIAEHRKQLSNAQNPQNAMDLTQHVAVTTEMDQTGLPRIVIRLPYANVLETLPQTLGSIGVKIQSVEKNKGLFKVNYQGASKAIFDKLAIESPSLEKGAYEVQLGDLINRTSLQINYNKKTKYLSEEQNKEMAALIDYAMNGAKE